MKLYLKDGSVYDGESFGSDTPSPPAGGGEVVFSTGMTGYVESLTDPSFAGQIVVCTYPLIGNYGVPSKEKFESPRIQIAGLIVSEYSKTYSHHEAKQSLGEWLKENNIPALSGIDTRELTKKIREKGAILGAIGEAKPKKFDDPNKRNLVAEVSIEKPKTYGNGKKTIIAIDCGMKENIARSLTHEGITLKRVPWNYDFTKEKYDGLFISNGPGDPVRCDKTIAHIKEAMKTDKPILGICLGNQLLALAAGAKTKKLKFGHRGQNQPAVDSEGLCMMTSQNHGFAVVDPLPKHWSAWYRNGNDHSIEGIKHDSKPWRAVQFHPEAAPGPTDSAWIFDDFISDVLKV